MEAIFHPTEQNRKLLYKFLKEIPREKWFVIPEGFNNNIWWNIAHVVVTQQLLVYKLSGKPMLLTDDIVDKYRKGTFPSEEPVSEEEVELVTKALFSTLEQTRKDYESGYFETYNEYTTSVQVTLKNVEEAMTFNLFHEGLHLGSVLALRKLV